MATPGAPGVARFGAFQFDPGARELRKGRTRLRVPDQSLAILAMLLERPGELVGRDAIQARLWPNGTIVEFEHSVNSAVKRLRVALSDTAATPRYVETLPRQGYRFIGTLENLPNDAAVLAPGTIISHYRILSEAGRGAMGVVYKAEDTDLGRRVALKFLSEELATHPPALDRLRREARMIAALNHHGICTVYELGEVSGRMFLVMEFLEGETLRERMARKPISKSELTDVAVQVAAALEVAHGEGMIHRDIKPDNLFLTKKGVVKLMDFGLAKPVEEEGSAPQSAITGTSGYMSPEQMRGEPLDARSDIYSLGKVLEELAGTSPPKGWAPILSKSLEEDRAKRWQTAGELRGALQATRRIQHPRAVLLASLAAALSGLMALTLWLRTPSRTDDLRPVPLAALTGGADMPSFSPDGNRVVFVYTTPFISHTRSNDQCGLYVKQVGGGAPVRLTTAESDFFPAWSPDDRNIAFLRRLGGAGVALMMIPAIGGTPRELARVDAASRTRISWTPDSRWLILSTRESKERAYGIFRYSADTGERRTVLPAPDKRPGSIDAWEYGDAVSTISPDSRVLVFARSLDTYKTKLYAVRLTKDWQPEGRIESLANQTFIEIAGFAWSGEREIVASIFAPDGGLFRIPVFGRDAPRRLNWAPGYACCPTVSRSQHRLVFVQVQDNQDLWRMDLHSGEFRLLIGSSYVQQIPQYSPDGRRIAFQSDRTGTLGLWTCDAEGGNCQQVTSFGGSIGGTPRWSPDGQWLAFDSRADGRAQIYVVRADGGPQRRLTSGDTENMVPSWSRDGRWIYFNSNRSGQFRVWKAPAAGGDAVQVTHNGGGAAFESTDGRYLYFNTDEIGHSSLFQMPVAGGDEKRVAQVMSWSSFSVVAKGVFFLSDPTTLQFLDEQTGQVRPVARLEKHSATQGITVSPDARYLLFADETGGRVDLQLVEGFR